MDRAAHVRPSVARERFEKLAADLEGEADADYPVEGRANPEKEQREFIARTVAAFVAEIS